MCLRQTLAEFDKLPIEVKNKWDNDVEKYIMAYGTQEWADKMGKIGRASCRERV